MSSACRPRFNAPAPDRRGRVRAVAVGAVVAALAVTADACTSSTTTLLYTPITGIVIRSQSLVSGFGCGEMDSQVYRYAAVLTYPSPEGGASVKDGAAPPAPLTNLFDCFADGVFENLSTTYGDTFTIQIYAYNKASYVDPSRVDVALPTNLGCGPTPLPGAAACAASTQTLTARQLSAARWKTSCVAMQQQGTPVLAMCGPLEAPVGADGSTDGAPDNSTDAPSESSASDASGGDGAGAGEAGGGSLDGASPRNADAAAIPDAADSAPSDAGASSG